MVEIVDRLKDIGAMSSDQEAARCAYDAMAEISSLRARCETAEAAASSAKASRDLQVTIAADEETRARRSEAQCAELVKVLEPFEVIATAILAEAPSEASFFILFQDCEGTAHRITLDQLRAMSSVLAAYRKESL